MPIDALQDICVSVVVPVYKVEYELLKNCLDSLIGQDSPNVEFIVIDDGSPDDCGSICDEYALRSPSMRVIHTVNSGVSHARNIGLDLARGSFVLFLDGDDQLPDLFLRCLCDNESALADITFFNYLEARDSSDAKVAASWVASEVPCARELTRAVLTFGRLPLNMASVKIGAPWGKVFRKSWLLQHNCRFPEGVRKTQDRIFMIDVLSYEPKCSYVPVVGYVYNKNNSSITVRYNSEAMNMALETRDTMRRVVQTRYGNDAEVYSWLSLFAVTIMFETVVDLDLFHRDSPYGILVRYRKFKIAIANFADDVKHAPLGSASSRRVKIATSLLRREHYLLAYAFLLTYARFKRTIG